MFCTYLDFQKALNKVSHQTYGIAGKSLAWIHSFLSNGRQQVFNNGDYRVIPSISDVL